MLTRRLKGAAIIVICLSLLARNVEIFRAAQHLITASSMNDPERAGRLAISETLSGHARSSSLVHLPSLEFTKRTYYMVRSGAGTAHR